MEPSSRSSETARSCVRGDHLLMCFLHSQFPFGAFNSIPFIETRHQPQPAAAIMGSANMDITSTITLNTTPTIKIPQLGFGVYKSPKDICVKSCLTALDVGYRHIDTAQCYGNEAQVGEAVKQSSLPRDQLFITTKILKAEGSVEASYQSLLDSVEKLDSGGYVDLFLIHSPNSGKANNQEMWQALEKLYTEGKAKSIGVSNFGEQAIVELKEVASVWPPHVNQIEVSTKPSKLLDWDADTCPASPLVSAEESRLSMSLPRHSN